MFTTLQTEFQKSIQPAARTAETSRTSQPVARTPYGSAALWSVFNPRSVYNPMQSGGAVSDVVQQQGGVARWIQDDMGLNANNMSQEDLLRLNQQYEMASTDLGNNWERQRVIDKATGQDVASNDYYHEPFNLMKDVVMPASLIWGGGFALSNLLAGAGAGAGGLSGMDLAADAALGSGNNVITAGQALSGAGGLAGTAIPAYAQAPGYGETVATLADAAGASPFTAAEVAGNGAWLGEGAASGVGAWDAAAGLGAAGGGATAGAVFDPLAAYMTTGAVEGSTIGSALTGAGGAAGAVGAGTAAGTLGTLGGVASALGGTGGLLNFGGNLLNSYLGYKASDKAADAQINASREANALAKYMYDQTRTDNMPALNARNAGLTGYQNLLQNPSIITSDPGYQFGFNQGQAAYDNSGAARGMRLSGAQAKALTRFGQDYGQTKFNESLNRYGNLAGLGQTGSGTIANAGMNYANTAGNNITGAGNAAASGYIGGANAITGGISNFLKGWQENQLLKQLGLGG